MNEPIVRIAARGDGVTPSGRHIPFGVPGDAVLDDGALAYGPHHQDPPCRHFPECGGCQLQHADDDAYRDYLVSRIAGALAQHGLTTEIRQPHLSPPRSRRRATLKALKVGHSVLAGFNAEMSHRIVDMRECHILRPELFELVDPLRALLADMLQPKRIAEIQLTLVDHGLDVQLKGVPAGRLNEIERLTAFAMDYQLARLSRDRGLGPETLYEPSPATVTLSGIPSHFLTVHSCRQRQTARAPLSKRSRKPLAVQLRSPTFSPGWAPSRLHRARFTLPKHRATRRRR